MSFYQYPTYFGQVLRSRWSGLPYPGAYPYSSPAPNLCNDSYCSANYFPEYFQYGPTDICYDSCPYQDPSIVLGYKMPKLISNIPGQAINTDLNLLDPWGLTVVSDIIWVANTSNGLITMYNLRGEKINQLINVVGPNTLIGQPTGIVHNDSMNSFLIFNGQVAGSSSLLICTRNGTINGYNTTINPTNSLILIDNSAANSVYTGIAVSNFTSNGLLGGATADTGGNLVFNNERCNLVYVTDFYNGKIDVFNGLLRKIDMEFVDQDSSNPIPEDFAPFNITKLNDLLYVTYAKQSPYDNQYPFFGSGLGYVSVFKPDGTFVRRLCSNGALNAPWGTMYAPSCFGYPAGSIMIGNYGDGTINVYDFNGQYIGSVKDGSNNIICLGGLKGLVSNPQSESLVYWTASDNYIANSYVGTITIRQY